ncbi:MAG TPA: phosphoribosylformylglycinamidine synthase subunit PurS [Bacteroidales bacterium]|jgi:phosphoribosylformylglycinamidine synthase|nr:phosphoribosylformylglycinamidine synthase subunit PurS [Bacteroidales bacterium]HXK80885.1 phosphoribosylformylglycinamidine synthase subunit PurS [Bacteroidales bacterium]
MKFIAEIDVMPLKALLDPQGKAVNRSMNNIGFDTVENVRIGKHISFTIEAENKEKAEKLVDKACSKILSNPIMEGYSFTIKKID